MTMLHPPDREEFETELHKLLRDGDIATRKRLLWLPAPVVKADPAKTTRKIGDQLMEFIEKELAGASEDVLVKEANDIVDAVREKIDEVLARRGTSLAVWETLRVLGGAESPDRASPFDKPS